MANEISDLRLFKRIVSAGSLSETARRLNSSLPAVSRNVGLQTSHRYGNATVLESDFVCGIGNRWVNRHDGYTTTLVPTNG
jgi:glyoxylate carboligase